MNQYFPILPKISNVSGSEKHIPVLQKIYGQNCVAMVLIVQ